METSLEPALTVLEDRESYSEFVRNVILRLHLEQIPDTALRNEFVAELVSQAAADTPPFSLDYWRLNLHGKVPRVTPEGIELSRLIRGGGSATGF